MFWNRPDDRSATVAAPDTPVPLEPAVGLGHELHDEMLKVTLEEYRLAESRFETDSRLGRELLYLLSNNEWLRRTTETINIDRVSAADTTIVVDVDPGYVVHEALRMNQGLLWLPLVGLPPDVVTNGGRAEAAVAPVGRRRRREPPPFDLPVSLQVTDVTGARLADLPQSEVRRQLAAALAETLVNRINLRHEYGDTPGHQLAREHQILMASAIAQMLAVVRHRQDGFSSSKDLMEQGPGNRLEHLQSDLDVALRTEIDRAKEDLDQARDGDHYRGEFGPAPSALRSREAQLLQAVRGIMLVVVPVRPGSAATSFTIRMPSRRLGLHRRLTRSSIARVRLGLLVPSAHADRVIEIEIPAGVRCARNGDSAGGFRSGRELQVSAGITVLAPAQYEEFRMLGDRLADNSNGELPDWVRKQLAELAVVKLDAVIQSLRQHYLLVDDEGIPSTTDQLLGELFQIRESFAELARGKDTIESLREQWPLVKDRFSPDLKLRRRLQSNTVSPGSVRFGANAIDEFTLRAEPVDAFVELVVVPDEAPVIGTASAVNLMNVILLLGVTLGLAFVGLDTQGRPALGGGERAQVLAAVLTIFPTIQAARVSRPDPGLLSGLLQVPHFWLGLATAAPGVLLAAALSFWPEGYPVVIAAATATGLQLLAQVAIGYVRRPAAEYRRPGIRLYTEHAPDHAELNALHTVWGRSLTGEALLFGRTAFSYLVVQKNEPDILPNILREAQGGRPEVSKPALFPPDHSIDDRNRPETPSVNLLGLLLGSAAEQSAMYLVFREEPEGLRSPVPGPNLNRLVRRLPAVQNRLVPVEPSEWVLDIMVGIDRDTGPRLPINEHPLRFVADATKQAGFTILNVRLPAPPPHNFDNREWLRLRVGVPHRAGETLDRLVTFLLALHSLRQRAGISVRLREVPQMATLDSTQTAPEDTFESVPGKFDSVSGRLDDRKTFLVTDDQVEVLNVPGDDAWSWLIPVCAPDRIGLMSRLLGAISEREPSLSLAAALTGSFNGVSVSFLLCRGSGDETRLRDVAKAVEAELDRSDHASIPIKTAVGVAPWTPADDAGPRALLRVQMRTPDRPGALQHLLLELHVRLCEAVGRQLGHLDVLYAMTPVVDGHSLSGRLVLGLPEIPGHDVSAWGDQRWQDIGRVVSRGLASGVPSGNGSRPTAFGTFDRTSRLSDDTVVTLNLVRANVPESKPEA